MGAGLLKREASARQQPMRCRSQAQVPRCFQDVRCPYPQAETVHGTFGAINYSLTGPELGEVVVCFHGLNGSRLLFQDTATYLSRHGGFRVLTFDLYGHGLSNAPPVDLCPSSACSSGCAAGCCSSSGARARYDLRFFVEQTSELLELIGLGDARVNLVGFSLGGAVAMAFAQRYPKRVKRIAAISPAGFVPHVPTLYYGLRACWCCLIPLAPHVLCTCWYKKDRFARSFQGQGENSMDEQTITNLWSRFVWQLFVKRGVARATLATCNRINWFNLSDLYQEVGRSPRPVLLLWGERDKLNPPNDVGQKVAGFFSNAKLVVVPRAGHIALCDKPAEVVPRILGFLQLPENASMSAVKELRAVRASQAHEEVNESTQLLKRDGNAEMPVPMVLGNAEDDVSAERGAGISLSL
ncbi:unnamed protein product [Effrenium voratum]|uniref:AB hydrolase-1 domain-containing protein n=1 Tax=Effrenium voratum TaxID=2562239 RepID=A0AA36JIU3_9DINO|nr:unnamed protein product [Effrenium voratum]CAJ1406391.1 unnamed protein product [Effrenium voratum]CAJ1425834.1 unnamed protein product [Effrenium voratum]